MLFHPFHHVSDYICREKKGEKFPRKSSYLFNERRINPCLFIEILLE